jgi:hypothetical protein
LLFLGYIIFDWFILTYDFIIGIQGIKIKYL